MGWLHNDVIRWKHFSRYWPFVRGIHRSPVNSPHKGQWRGALRISLICVWIDGWVNNGEAGDFRRHRAHYDVTVMKIYVQWQIARMVVQWLPRYNIPHFFTLGYPTMLSCAVGGGGGLPIMSGQSSCYGTNVASLQCCRLVRGKGLWRPGMYMSYFLFLLCLTQLGLVYQMPVVRNSSHLPSDAYMRH